MDKEEMLQWLTIDDLEIPETKLVGEYQNDEEFDIPKFPEYVVKHCKSRVQTIDGPKIEDVYFTKVSPTICDGQVLYVGSSPWNIFVENGHQHLGRVFIGTIRRPDGNSFNRYCKTLVKADITEETVVVTSENSQNLIAIATFLIRKEYEDDD